MRARTGRNAIWFMAGTTMTKSSYLTTVADLDWYIGGVGDYDSDGTADILWRHDTTGGNAVWLMAEGVPKGYGYLLPVGETLWKITGPR